MNWLHSERWKNFWTEWQNFLIIIFTPWTLCLIIATLVFAYLSASQIDAKSAPIMAVIFSILSGLTGGFISKNWLDLSEQRVLVTRGKSAIRSLILLFSNTSAARNRMVCYLDRIAGNKDMDRSVLSNWLEEELIRLDSIMHETVTSVENWTDIIPEANIRPELNKLEEETSRVVAIRKEHEEIESKLNEARMEGQVSGEKKAKEELQERLAALDQALEHAEEKVRETQGKLNRSVLSGLSVGPSESIIKGIYAFPSIIRGETCQECGKKYEPEPLAEILYPGSRNICPECKSKS